MASIQACGSGEIYHGRHKNVVNEMWNMAHDVVKKQHCHDHEATTGGCIKNNTKSNFVKFFTQHDFTGHPEQDYPRSIAKSESGTFFHFSDFSGLPDVAAVGYYDECGSCWLVAWNVVKDGSDGRNKVYVETGPAENYRYIKWHEINNKLDVSTDTSYYMDSPRGNEAFAKITTNGSKAALAVIFNTYST